MADLKEDLKKEKANYGVNVTLKKLKQGKLKKIYIASNCALKDDLLRYAERAGIEVVELEENSVQLGIACRRSHNISAISF